MTLQSMTGFARSQGRVDSGGASGRWIWEVRSVNAKGLDIRLRLPPGLESVETAVRRAIADRLARGNLQATLHFEPDAGALVPVLNETMLDALITHIDALRQRLGSPPPSAESVLSIRGILEFGEARATPEELATRDEAVVDGIGDALRQLVDSRIAEGRAIVSVLVEQVGQIRSLVGVVAADPSRQAGAIRERLAGQLARLLDDPASLDPQRLHQEAAILATRADISEEIDRLQAHVEAALALLRSQGPAGRKLDFLAQEFNRECNTICAKATASAVVEAGLEMKVMIDRFREQVQNLE